MVLDIEQLQTFRAVVQHASFTRAAGMLGTTQAAVSLRIGKLEAQLGRRLLARTARRVALTLEGARFLKAIEPLLSAHDGAVAFFDEPVVPLLLRGAISDHALGGHLSQSLSRLKARQPDVLLEITVGHSVDMRAAYEAGAADFAIIRTDLHHRTGLPLFNDQLVWCGQREATTGGGPVPLLVLREPCSIRAAATKALDDGRIPWRMAFLAGSVQALQAAAQAGLGIAPIARSHIPPGCAELGAEDGLPPLPDGKVVLLTNLANPLRTHLLQSFGPAGR